MVSRIALQVLCSFWGFTTDYLEYVTLFLSGVDWDESDALKLMAISIAGDYLDGRSEQRLLAALVQIVESPTEFKSIRQAGYEALLRAEGRSLRDVILARSEFDPTDRAVVAAIARAQQRLDQDR
jgi:Flp pilus assembly protein TadD